MKASTISFYTLGCRLNQSETAVIQNSFSVDGYRVVDFDQPAEIVVINTCTVTENGDADTRRLVNKINRLNPQARIALVGCQAQTQKEKLTQLPNVRWVVGNEHKMDLVSLIKKLEQESTPQVITPTISRKSFTIPFASIDSKHTRANIKIQDGCDFFCSFCEIPYARGRARSRNFQNILQEVNALVKAGYKEVIITGINVGTYQESGYSFLDVINALEQVDGLERIRISSIEPTTVPIELIKKMSKQTKLCRYLHIPLQSGHDDILQLMKRKYTYQEFAHFIQQAFEIVPQICIGTDVIVGFPGESDAHFALTQERLQQLPINYFHTFSYSKRTMAKSQNFPHEISDSIIQKRSQILRDLSLRKQHMFYESLVNTTQQVLFEVRKNDYWTGLTDHYVRVIVKSEEDLRNQILNVRLNKVLKANVLGELC